MPKASAREPEVKSLIAFILGRREICALLRCAHPSPAKIANPVAPDVKKLCTYKKGAIVGRNGEQDFVAGTV